MANRKRGFLEHPSQLTFDHLRGPDAARSLNHEDFFVLSGRQRFGCEAVAGPLVSSNDHSVNCRRHQGSGIGHGDTHGVMLRHLRCILPAGDSTDYHGDLLLQRTCPREIRRTQRTWAARDPCCGNLGKSGWLMGQSYQPLIRGNGLGSFQDRQESIIGNWCAGLCPGAIGKGIRFWEILVGRSIARISKCLLLW